MSDLTGAPLEATSAPPSTLIPPSPPAGIAFASQRHRTAVKMMRVEFVAVPALVLSMLATLLTGLVPMGLGLVLALLPVPLVAALLLRLDRFEPEPTRLLVRTFLWGAGVAILVAGIINTTVALTAGDAVATVVSAPVVEEIAKAAALLLVIRIRPGFLHGVHDGMIYAAWVALGFATVENIGYYAEAFAEEGAGGLAALFVLRGIMTPFAHPVFTAMTGIALGYAISRPFGRLVKVLIVSAGLLAAIGLHALWNVSTLFGIEVTGALYLLVYLPLLGVALVLLIVSARRERQILREGLRPEVQHGTVTAAEYDALIAGGRARARMRRRARKAGRQARDMLHTYEAAAYELAHANARGSRPGHPPAEQIIRDCRQFLGAVRPALADRAPGVLRFE